jgi:hypothetical protein
MYFLLIFGHIFLKCLVFFSLNAGFVNFIFCAAFIDMSELFGTWLNYLVLFMVCLEERQELPLA